MINEMSLNSIMHVIICVQLAGDCTVGGNGLDTHLYSVSGGTGSPGVVHAAETAAPV